MGRKGFAETFVCIIPQWVTSQHSKGLVYSAMENWQCC